ncbi:hypothetical protein AVEN_28961-1 [Araneus ventricosus]|uniref:Uncharacterized protein n=1 Tax=Araneus ventricosus TaxID=182803 RepID=A0A4Y2AJ59_ARAVE|nr:hypothetical protein AVEN_28961-1 [Araneus ventricosus]
MRLAAAVVEPWFWDGGSRADSTEDPPCIRAVCTLSVSRVKRPPAGVMPNVGGRDTNSRVVLVIRPWFKVTRTVPK